MSQPTNHDLLEWETLRTAIKEGRQEILIAYPWDSGVPGTHCVVATVYSMPYPMGLLYYRQSVKAVYEILDFHVIEGLRGAGIGGKLLAGLLNIATAHKYTAIYTQEVTAKSKSIIAKAGYKKSADGYWLKLKTKGAK